MATTAADIKDRASQLIPDGMAMVIGGESVAAQGGGTFTTYDPGTGVELTTVPQGGAADVDAAVVAARAALPGWRGMAPAERANLVWRLGDLIDANVDELSILESLESGKPLTHTQAFDIPSSAASYRYMAGWATRLSGITVAPSGLPTDSTHAYTRTEPVGVVGAIVPWNFPMAIAAWKVAPALACGNTVVLKPAEQTPLTAIRLGQLALEAGIPAGVLNVVTGDGETGKALVAHPGVNKISFTGSTVVGREIMRTAADDMKRVTLELGGKSPNVIFEDADVDAAIAGAALGIFYDSGEVCTAGSRILVQESILDRVLEGLEAQAGGWALGHGLDAETQLGPLISAEHRERVSGFVSEAAGEGVKVAFGGSSPERDGYFFEPTVLVDPSPGSRVAEEEIFGPVATLTAFRDMDHALEIANSSPYGLGAAVWTRDVSKAHIFAAQVEAGTVWVNTYHLLDPALPFGGYKQSGMGRENGEDVVRHYTETKTVLVALG